MDRVVNLTGIFLTLSLLAVGGVTTTLPEMHTQIVGLRGWMSDEQFARLFAISQVAPGPNAMVVSLMGWQIAGWPGMIASTLAFSGPSCLLAFALSRARRRLARAVWLRQIRAGLVPITVGLVVTSGLVIARSADHQPLQVAITVGVALVVCLKEVNPVWLLLGAALLGLLQYLLTG